jgi:hypothetical protein
LKADTALRANESYSFREPHYAQASAHATGGWTWKKVPAVAGNGDGISEIVAIR